MREKEIILHSLRIRQKQRKRGEVTERGGEGREGERQREIVKR